MESEPLSQTTPVISHHQPEIIPDSHIVPPIAVLDNAPEVINLDGVDSKGKGEGGEEVDHEDLRLELDMTFSALKSSLKTAKSLQLDWTKTAKDWTCSLGLSALRLESGGGPALSVETSLLYPYNYPSKHIQDHIFRTRTDEDILTTVKYFIQMVDVPEYFCMYLNSHT